MILYLPKLGMKGMSGAALMSRRQAAIKDNRVEITQ
jgi:hypothetical protein